MKRFAHFALAILIGMALLNGCGDDSGGGDNNATNHAPVATAQRVTTPEDTAKAITLSGTDEDNDTLTYTVASHPTHGTLSGTAPNLTYTPAANFYGSDRFTFTVNDGTVDSDPATVSITVTLVNHAPTASGFGMTLDVNASDVSTDWKSASSADDPDAGDTLSATVATQGRYGTFAVTGDTVTYLLETNTTQPDTGILSISDGHDTVNVTVTVDMLYWKQIAAGDDYTVAIKSDGTLWAWGRNDSGQLGDGTYTHHEQPEQIGTDTDWKTVSAGKRHTVALKTDGSLYAWGNNNYGQLGDGNTGTLNRPKHIGSDTNWTAVSAGDYHTVAIKNGTLWAWGRNNHDQLGNGDATHATQKNPVLISADNDWSAISAGDYHTVAIKNGTLWAWGRNNYGQLGNGDHTHADQNQPVQIGSDSDWTTVSAGSGHTVAIKSGTLKGWGSNSSGQLGIGSNANQDLPVTIGSSHDWDAVSAGSHHTVARKTDGSLYAWGENGSGQLGDGTDSDKNHPVRIGTDTHWSAISAGGSHTVAIKSGTLWAWGGNRYGQLGDGTTSEYPSPTQEQSHDTYWSRITTGNYHTVAIKSDGTLWAWGDNRFGQLGDGTTIYRSLPTQIGNDSGWSDVSAGNYHTVAIKNGTLWAWGFNNHGQLGNGDPAHADQNQPVHIGSDSNWAAVSAGGSHTVAIKNGTLWAWGRNNHGQLGNGDATHADQNQPVHIGSDSNWTAVSAGGSHTIAIKNGTLWAWGYNQFGQLGNNDAPNAQNHPVQIGSDSHWTAVSAGGNHTVAIKNGTLWAWGYNHYGQLGNNSTSDQNQPVQIGSDSDWTAVSAGTYHTAAIKNGRLWTWGRNYNGQLGDGTISTRTTPTPISGSDTWGSVSAGYAYTTAIKANGTLWAWGENTYGQLGVIHLILFVPKASIERK